MAGKFKRVPLAGLPGRKKRTYARQTSARMKVVGAQRGYLRTGGYYGRFSKKGGEMKFLDTTAVVNPVVAAGAVSTNLNVVAQGVGESQRIGRKITIRQIQGRMLVQCAASNAATAANDTLRVLLVQDRQANGATFAVTDVLQTASFQAWRNLQNSNRFKVLLDKTITVNSYGGVVAATFESGRSTNFFIKCNIPIEYDSTAATGAIATQRSNSLALVYLAEQSNVILTYNVRIRYTDE